MRASPARTRCGGRTPRPGGRFPPMTTETTSESTEVHGGRLVARRLAAHGVTKLFTLSGGHLFSVYDGCREEGIDIVDVRHESAAAFAAEGWAKVTREPGVCALTAGPGVTNGMSALGSALMNHSPMLVLGGRAPAMRWGQGSLQEIDHVPFVRPLTRFAATAGSTAEIPGLVDEAWAAARAAALRARVRRPPARPRVHGGRGRRGAGGHGDGARHARPRARARAARGGGAARDHGRHRPLLGPRRGGAARARGGAPDPGLPQRPRARVHPRRPRALLLARALDRAQGRRRRARRRCADGLPARLRQVVRRGHGDRRDRRRRARARPPARARRGALRRPQRDPVRPRRGPRDRHERLGRDDRRRRAREAGGRARAARGPARAAAPDAPVRRARRGARPQRDRDRRRRRLRLLRRPRDRLLRARLLARPGALRLPRLGPRLRARGEARAPRPPGRAAARRRRLRVLRDGVRHARPPRRQRRRGDGQQRHLGAGEAPDGGHLRLLRRRRPAARDALRPRGRGARRARGAGARAGRPARGARDARSSRASRRWSTCSPTRRSPTRARPTWLKRKPPAAGAGGFTLGPVRTGRGTCLAGAYWVA